MSFCYKVYTSAYTVFCRYDAHFIDHDIFNLTVVNHSYVGSFVAGLLLVVSFGVAMGIVVGGLLLCVVTVLTKR